MLASVVDLSEEFAPGLWRRYLALVLRGMAVKPTRPAPLPVAAPPFGRVDEMMRAGWGPKRG
jgi:hypothetical protein